MNHDPTTLIHAYLDGELAHDEQLALAAWLREGQDNVDRFTAECRLHSELCASCGPAAFDLPCNELHSTNDWANHDAPLPCPAPPIVLESSDPRLAPLFTLRSPLGSFVFSHVAAAVILGIGLLIGLAWRISLPSPEQLAPNTVAQSIAHITALADCEWSKQGSEKRGEERGERGETQISKSPNPQIPVFLGDRFSVSSGLMQITYDTGAVVLLQGPCTYEIDAADGGYLAVGKLTALVEKKAEVSNPQSLIPNPLFAVRTPTAVVTDLGTEFGVEVESSGATSSHVFQGSVEVRSSQGHRPDGSAVPVEILRVGESARVERGRSNKIIIIRNSIRPDRFVRHIHREDRGDGRGERTANDKLEIINHTSLSPEKYAEYVLSLAPVAYYRMEMPKSKKDRLVVFDSAPGGHHGEFKSLDTSITPYTAGRFGDAMSFRGNSMGDYVQLPNIPSAKGNELTVSVWARMTTDRPKSLAIFYRWGSPHKDKKIPGINHFMGSGAPQPLYRWHHIAYVINNNSGETLVRMYHDGIKKKQKNCGCVWPDMPEIYWSIGGIPHPLVKEKVVSPQYWQGQIDEVAIFNKVLSEKTIEQLYLGGAAVGKGDGIMNDP